MRLPTLLLLAAALAGTASAQIPLGTTPVTIDFDGFRGAGFAPSPAAGQLSSNDYDVLGLSDGQPAGTASLFGDVQDTGDFARGASTGGVTAGGVYAFETEAGDYALGVQPTGSDFRDGVINILFENTTGATLSGVTVQGAVKVYNDGPRSTGIGVGIIPKVVIGTDGQETSRGAFFENRLILPEIFSPGPADPTPTWASTPFEGTAEGTVTYEDEDGNEMVSEPFSVAPGENFYLRVFVGDNPNSAGSGTRDEIAVDDLVVTAVLMNVANEDGAAGEAGVRALYPNPVAASGSAQVVFSSPRSERVTVRVYDTLGRLVATAFDGPTAAASETRVALPARLAPGTYVVRVAGETFVSTRPLTVVR